MIRRTPLLDAVISLEARLERGVPIGARGPVEPTFRRGVGR